MLKTKDFYLKKVFNIKGKYVGVIQDITIDFFKGEILGFTISNYSLFNKKNFVKISDLVCMDDVVICKELSIKEGVHFKSLKYIEVINKAGKPIGVLEDLLISEEELHIKGLVISSGIFDRIIKGKEIILPSECVLGNEFILHVGCNNISLKTLPHNIVVNERQTKDI